MKKLMYVLVVILTIFTLTACGKKEEKNKNDNYSEDKTVISENDNKSEETNDITLEDVKSAKETKSTLFEYCDVEGGVSIIGFNGTDQIISIPTKIDNKPVVSVGDSAFANNQYLVGVKVNESVLEIGAHSFENCSVLKITVLGDSVKTIKEYAFNGCELLSDVILDEGLETIEKLSFGFTNISEIYIPSSVTAINMPFTANKERTLTIVSTVGSAAEEFVSTNGASFNIKFEAK